MTTPLFKKLNHKEQDIIIHSPAEFKKEMEAIKKTGHTIKNFALADVKPLKEIAFIVSFVQTTTEVEKIINAIDKKLIDDAVVWFAYPKGSSKKYKAEINRDNGWRKCDTQSSYFWSDYLRSRTNCFNG